MKESVVVKLPIPPSVRQFTMRIRDLTNRDSLRHDPTRLRFSQPHAAQRMAERNINMRQVLETLRKGKASNAPELDQFGDWRIKLTRKVAGRRVQVVVALKANHVLVVTVI